MSIKEDEYMGEVIDKSQRLYLEALELVLEMIRVNKFRRKKQKENSMTYSIWRDEIDCKIDWNKSSNDIYNLIRAVSYPYSGAYTCFNNERIIINRAEKLKYDINFAIRDSGKIWTINDSKPVVVCGKGLLRIIDAEYKNRRKVFFKKIRSRMV